ncbi:hypothetical protein F5884DRAFT_2468 [Xylogone sp. PMI_703]|nr:hypothetical protein F5884DRAFT_2468 [Xylogone sp. PMI_703]
MHSRIAIQGPKCPHWSDRSRLNLFLFLFSPMYILPFSGPQNISRSGYNQLMPHIQGPLKRHAREIFRSGNSVPGQAVFLHQSRARTLQARKPLQGSSCPTTDDDPPPYDLENPQIGSLKGQKRGLRNYYIASGCRIPLSLLGGLCIKEESVSV